MKNMFGGCAEKANEEHRVIQRQRKFTVSSFAQSFILALLQKPNSSAAEIAAMAASCNAEVTPQAIEKRFTARAADFFRSLFQHSAQQIVRSDQELAPLLERFTDVVLIDGSTINLPDSQAVRFKGRGGSHGFGKSAMKLQTELSLKTGELKAVDVEQGRDSDMACDRQTVPRPVGTLRITDLGYFAISVFESLATAGSWFLSRIQWTTIITIDGIRQGNVVDFLNSQKVSLIDCWVEIGTANRIHCRLIAWRVPQSVAASRRRKLYKSAKKRGRDYPSADALAACDWMFLVTNLASHELSIKEAIVLYRARWQIELLFKRWKSIGLIADLHGKNDDEKMVRLWVKLCAALIQHWLTVMCGWRTNSTASFMRIAKLVSTVAESIALSLGEPDTESLLVRVLQQFYKKTSRSTHRNKRKKIGTLELLQNPEKLDYVLS